MVGGEFDAGEAVGFEAFVADFEFVIAGLDGGEFEIAGVLGFGVAGLAGGGGGEFDFGAGDEAARFIHDGSRDVAGELLGLYGGVEGEERGREKYGAANYVVRSK